ncbi:MAG: hypothetical protein NT007_06120 [Candidatus Kapabacteria bacterium]|nr:hypothetical protein [Candidatus Kapabacteria bacterium]
MKPTFDELLDTVDEFDISEQELLVDILNKKIISEHRKQIEMDVEVGMIDYQNNNVSRGNREKLKKEILS